tara:strand:+ start:1217 stop:1666 length:450 start_codon:yes stop_codon:yes gene_type:complete
MFKFFKKKELLKVPQKNKFEIELTALVLAYEVARSDGDISESELNILLQEIKKIAPIVNKDENDILEILKKFSKNSVSFHEFIEDINKEYSKNEKLSLITILWGVAFADSILEVDEERLIRRIADLVHIKDIDVLKIKDKVKQANINNL